MTASLETLVVAAYIFADGVAIPRPGPEGKICDAELIALSVAQAAMAIPSDRQFLGLVGRLVARGTANRVPVAHRSGILSRPPARHPSDWSLSGELAGVACSVVTGCRVNAVELRVIGAR